MLTPKNFRKSLDDSYIKEDTHLYLAISGGVDSMVLYDLLKKTFPKHTLTLLHVHYGLRKESVVETDYLKEMAANDKMPLKIAYFPKTINFTEEKGRRFRYDFFQEEMVEKGVLLTAHHLNDLGETLLMKLTRGSRLEKLAFPPFRLFGKGHLYRPLLSFSKAEIYQYAAYHQLVYFEDCSNLDLHYQRNRYRHEIIPLFLKENPNFLSYLYERNQELITLSEEKIETFDLKRFLILSSEKKHTYLKQWLTGQGIVLNVTTFKNLLLFLENSTKQTFQLSSQYLQKENGYLVLKKISQKEFPTSFELTCNTWLQINTREKIGYFEISYPMVLESGHYEILDVTGEIPQKLYYRSPQTGDYLKLKEAGYTKKLNHYFKDEKIPFDKRPYQKIVAKENQEVLWIPPKGKSYLSYPNETDKITYRLIYNKKV